MREIGLHLRLHDSFLKIARQAHELDLPIFQCFFIGQETHERVPISDEETQAFLKEYRPSFERLYLHGSYWINLASVRPSHQHVFFRERELAARLSFTHMVIHPGAATGGHSKQEGIEALARFLNKVCAQESSVKLVLENNTHAGLSVGGDIQDFGALLQKLDYPDRIFFCIDTAHAYSYGYDLHDATHLASFMDDLGKMIGFSRIVLIHLNDTKERLRSRIDRHAIVGEGHIGEKALREFAMDKRLQHSDIILELPTMPLEQEMAVYKQILAWK